MSNTPDEKGDSKEADSSQVIDDNKDDGNGKNTDIVDTNTATVSEDDKANGKGAGDITVAPTTKDTTGTDNATVTLTAKDVTTKATPAKVTLKQQANNKLPQTGSTDGHGAEAAGLLGLLAAFFGLKRRKKKSTDK